MGKSASTSTVIRPSKRIIYDTMEAVVSFLSENVNTCVDEFLEEWARVSKMVVIAREGTYVISIPYHGLADAELQLHKWRKRHTGKMSACCRLICKLLNLLMLWQVPLFPCIW